MAKHTLIEQLEERQSQIPHGSMTIGGPSLLTFPAYNDSGRMVMFNSHINQRVVLNKGKTQFPKVFGNFENVVGEYNSYNNKTKTRYQVLDIICKFPDVESASNNQTKLYIVHDLDNDLYDIIERYDVEDLMMKYGFTYDNEVIDSYQVGDIIDKGVTITSSTSYDGFGNYGFGANVDFMYLIDDDIIEDAIIISESLRKMMESTEVETVKVPINDNDFLINLYGDVDNYKTFPDVGEVIKDKIICSKRRINLNQVLYDMKSSNTRRILPSDSKFYMEGEISDINIYCNKTREELIDANFNSQIIRYLDMQNAYYNRIKEVTQCLIDENRDKCSDKLKYYNKLAKDMTNPDLKIKDESNSVFSNIIIYFTVKKVVGAAPGQKFTGRFGNKGVIAKVYPDELMPITDTGRRVHIIFESLGVYNRLNIFQLDEQSINFVTQRVIEYIRENNLSYEEQEKIIFRVMEIFNPEESEKLHAVYRKMSKKEKDEFHYITDKYGIYIHIKPFWHSKNIFDCVRQCYKEFPWIKKYKVYFWDEVSERYVKMMNDQVIGSMYIMKLMQSGKKNHSVCSNSPISRFGIPEKTDSAKKHRSLNSTTAIRFGLQENTNSNISVNPKYTAKLHLAQRSSPVLRRILGSTIIDNYGEGLPIEPELTANMTNRNVEILQAYFKFLGVQLNYDNDDIDISQPDDKKTTHMYKGERYFTSSKYMRDIIAREEVQKRMNDNEIGYIYVGPEGEEKSKFIDKLVDVVEEEMLKDGIKWFND